MQIDLSNPKAIDCPKCQEHVVPKYNLQNGVPSSSACPKCGKIFEHFGFLGLLIGVYEGFKSKFLSR
jgi:hypothetical protein